MDGVRTARTWQTDSGPDLGTVLLRIYICNFSSISILIRGRDEEIFQKSSIRSRELVFFVGYILKSVIVCVVLMGAGTTETKHVHAIWEWCPLLSWQ